MNAPGRLSAAALSTLLLLTGLLSACSSRGPAESPQASSAPAKTDSAPRPLPDHEVAAIPDAVPRNEPRTRAGNANPYTVLGQTYHLLPDSRGYRETGVASWYGMKFHGRRTANGERYDVFGMTAAHRTLPIPSYVRVRNLENGREIVVRVNDRGPFHDNRIIDLSWVAAQKLGFANRGTARVEVVAVHPEDPPAPALQHAVSAPASPLPEAGKPVAANSLAAAPRAQAKAQAPGDWYFQVGAYRDYTAAQQVHVALAEQLPGQVAIESGGQDGFHRVRVGPLGDDDHVRRVRSILASKQILQPLLISD